MADGYKLIHEESYRKKVGYVPQESKLFSPVLFVKIFVLA